MEAKRQMHEASREYANASRTLAAYQEQKANLRWYQTMTTPEEVVVKTEQRAKDDYFRLKREYEGLQQNGEVQKEVGRMAGMRNTPLAEHADRLKAWQNQANQLGRDGLREHALEWYAKKERAPVRWAREADRGVPFTVLRKSEKGLPLHNGTEMHFALLRAPDGSRVLQQVDAHDPRGQQLGQAIKLELGARGELALSRDVDRGRGR
jgi:hypothetical protein